MSARRHLHLLLVASLIVILFALVPAKAESAEVKIIEIEHFNAKEENQIEVSVVNNDQELINCNLVLTIYSIDLMENIALSDSITFFDVSANDNYTHIFSFNIPLSGEYLFNFSLLTERNDSIHQYYQSKVFTFYDVNRYDLGQMIVDFYFDPEDSNSIANAMQEIMTNSTLRKKLALENYNKSKCYSWNNCANETFGFIRSVLN